MAASAFIFALGAVVATSALATSVSPYGEVARFGGFDSSATYPISGAAKTENLSSKVGEQAKLVYPLAMTVDTKDPQAPDEYAVYVLENLNPQALDAVGANSSEPTDLSLEYRIQKISDKGVLLASTTFTLASSPSEPGLHATSLAVNGAADRVYALVTDVPAVAENTSETAAVDAIDAWTAGRSGKALEPAVGLTTGADDKLTEDTRTHAGELVGPGILQNNLFIGDIDGASIAVYGTGPNAELALAGNTYTSATAIKPIVELVKTSEAGQVEPSPWTNTAGTENATAKTVAQKSEDLYSMSSNPDGSLNISLGPKKGVTTNADLEPNTATIGTTGVLGPTTTVLPGSIAAENFPPSPKPKTTGPNNIDGAATMGYTQDIALDGSGAFQPTGATWFAGTLAPSMVQLAGGGAFPAGLYAGVVAAPEGSFDTQNPIPSTLHSWTQSQAAETSGNRSIVSPASLGLRVFDASSDSLGMIGNVTPGGPCNLQSSPTVLAFKDSVTGNPSFVALAGGREGVLFALVQPDLLNKEASSSEFISPGLSTSVGASMGDQVVEFAPGANSTGAGSNASKWQECPQPSGNFSIANETLKEPPTAGSGEVAVTEGTSLKFDAGTVTLHGSSPWAYNWNLEGGVSNTGAGPLFEFPWSVRNTFTAEPEKGKAWLWPSSTVEAEFKTPGTYTESLKLVNDFGTLTAQRTVRVIAAGVIEKTKVSASSAPTEGAPVLLSASATLPSGDKVKNYHWEFGDGAGEDTGEAAEAQHVYEHAGKYTVKLSITDALGKTASAEEEVSVAAVAKEKHETNETPVPKQEAPQPKQELPAKVTMTKPSTTKPLTRVQKLTKALKTCKKLKSKKKRIACEKTAKKKYAPKKKSTKKK
jgi:hypothetical protein